MRTEWQTPRVFSVDLRIASHARPQKPCSRLPDIIPSHLSYSSASFLPLFLPTPFNPYTSTLQSLHLHPFRQVHTPGAPRAPCPMRCARSWDGVYLTVYLEYFDQLSALPEAVLCCCCASLSQGHVEQVTKISFTSAGHYSSSEDIFLSRPAAGSLLRQTFLKLIWNLFFLH